VVGAGASIGAGAAIHPHAVVGVGAEIGPGTVLHPGAVVYDGVVIGARCIVHSSAVVGADGYGFDPTPAGWVKIPQLGTVIVEDDVEIGAACTIDRGRFGPTRVRRGAKLDDQVHVGHNVEVGEHAMLAAQVGIAGSALIGSRVMMGGQVGISGHLCVGDGARLAGKTGPFGDVPAGAEFLGYPGLPRREALRQQALLGRLPRLVERLGELEARVVELEARAAAGGIDA
jgi:UDP-3-O-[3-hydroxymyristoyl] glucosamine N-acyltransferase